MRNRKLFLSSPLKLALPSVNRILKYVFVNNYCVEIIILRTSASCPVHNVILQSLITCLKSLSTFSEHGKTKIKILMLTTIHPDNCLPQATSLTINLYAILVPFLQSQSLDTFTRLLTLCLSVN